MRNLMLSPVARFRVQTAAVFQQFGSLGDETCGAFAFPARRLRAVASSGMGWDHVSVSRPDRTPRWEEMSYIHRMFFEDHEAAMQLHVPPADHVNHHPFCLHLWRPHGVDIPRPPMFMVGPK